MLQLTQWIIQKQFDLKQGQFTIVGQSFQSGPVIEAGDQPDLENKLTLERCRRESPNSTVCQVRDLRLLIVRDGVDEARSMRITFETGYRRFNPQSPKLIDRKLFYVFARDHKLRRGYYFGAPDIYGGIDHVADKIWTTLENFHRVTF